MVELKAKTSMDSLTVMGTINKWYEPLHTLKPTI